MTHEFSETLAVIHELNKKSKSLVKDPEAFHGARDTILWHILSLVSTRKITVNQCAKLCKALEPVMEVKLWYA